MSSGCAIIASDTPAIREAIRDNETGILVDFFCQLQLVEAVSLVTANGDRIQRKRSMARRVAVNSFDLLTVCLPQQIRLLS
jgi:glycosyltransferase involved in cell wall biosynthesis